MNIDRFIGLAGLFAGVVGIALAILFYRRTIHSKILTIGRTGALPLVVSVPEVKNFYLGAERACVYRAFVLFWNRGTSPIESTDFVMPICVKGGHDIVSLKIVDKDTAASVTIDQPSGVINIEILRPGESFVLQIDASIADFRPDINIMMKSSEMSQVLENLPTLLRFLERFPAGFLYGLFCGMFIAGPIAILAALRMSLVLAAFLAIASVVAIPFFSIAMRILGRWLRTIMINPPVSRFFEIKELVQRGASNGKNLVAVLNSIYKG